MLTRRLRQTALFALTPTLAAPKQASVGAQGLASAVDSSAHPMANVLAYDPSGSPPYDAAVRGLRLITVITVMRHGDRGPIAHAAGRYTMDSAFWHTTLPDINDVAAWDERFPVDGPPKPIDSDGAPFGMLTELGAQQVRAYGREVRSRYKRHAPHLLSEVNARSTNIRRTQQTAQNFLLGLGAEPTSVLVRDWENENLVPKPKHCPALAELLTTQAEASAAEGGEDGAFRQSLGELLGYEGGALRIDQAREVLTCALAHAGAPRAPPLPSTLRSEDVLRLLGVNGRDWARKYSAAHVPRLAMGLLVAEIESLLSEAVVGGGGGGGGGGLRLLSGHDSTLVPLLCALGVYDSVWPRYAAHLELELARSEAGEHFVRLLYDGEVLLPIEPDVGGAWMRWERFQSEVLEPASVTQSAYDAECAQAHGPAGGAGGDQSLSDTLTSKGGAA
eukprot:1840971-Prymnesium_polylepis.1